MDSFVESTGMSVGVMFLLLLILIIILAVITLSMSIRLSRLTKKHQMFMKGRDGESMEAVFKSKLGEIQRISDENKQLFSDVELIKQRFSATYTHYGVVKYDAFDDVGGKMSFALALLDDADSGFIINTVHSRDNCFLYLKEIVNGESYIMLSNEEVEALNYAASYKEEMKTESN